MDSNTSGFPGIVSVWTSLNNVARPAASLSFLFRSSSAQNILVTLWVFPRGLPDFSKKFHIAMQSTMLQTIHNSVHLIHLSPFHLCRPPSWTVFGSAYLAGWTSAIEELSKSFGSMFQTFRQHAKQIALSWEDHLFLSILAPSSPSQSQEVSQVKDQLVDCNEKLQKAPKQARDSQHPPGGLGSGALGGPGLVWGAVMGPESRSKD